MRNKILVTHAWINGIGGRQHNVVSNALRHFVWSNFQHAWCETHAWCTCVYLVNDCAFWWEVTVVEAYHSSALQWFTPKCTSSSATHLQSLILNLVYRVACPLCHQVVLVRRLLMCWLHPQNWLAVRFLIRWLTSKFVEIATPEMLWSGYVTNIDFTGIQICSNFLSIHERILEGSDPLHIND